MESDPSVGAAELSSAAQQVIYTIRHVVRDQDLDDALALRHARALLLEPVMGVSPDEEYAALVEALRSEQVLSTWRDDPRFERPIAEQAFRGHLRRVVDKLDEMRPWPIPHFRALARDRWASYGEARAVGRIDLPVPKVEGRIHIHLSPMDRPDRDGQVRVVVLELRSGREIALVGRWWPDAPRATAVLTRDPDVSAEDVMAELTSAGHFEPGEYEVLH